jgi:hypothetical protein
MKTIGRLPSRKARVVDLGGHLGGLLDAVDEGRRTWRGWAANWARIELPKVSAVMPVPSETKNTVRSGMKLQRSRPARPHGHDKEELPRIGSNIPPSARSGRA